MNGGTLEVESGKRTYRKVRGQDKPYFMVEGQSIDDDGGDVHVVVYRCKATGNIEGEFADGAFFVTIVRCGICTADPIGSRKLHQKF